VPLTTSSREGAKKKPASFAGKKRISDSIQTVPVSGYALVEFPLFDPIKAWWRRRNQPLTSKDFLFTRHNNFIAKVLK